MFTDPGGWLVPGEADINPQKQSPVTDVLAFLGLAAPDDNNHLIKRVIGLPGDHVKCCTATGQLTVNGTPLVEPYLNLPAGVTQDDPYKFSVTVPKGDLWVMGDHRGDSADSRYQRQQDNGGGFVPVKDVVGRAFVVAWPISHWATLSVPSTFHQSGLAGSALQDAPSAALGGTALVLPMSLWYRRRRRNRR